MKSPTKNRVLSKSENKDIHPSNKLFDNRIGEQEWLDTKEAAEYLRLPVGTVLNWTSEGKIPVYKLGRSNRYRLSELRSLLLSNRRGG